MEKSECLKENLSLFYDHIINVGYCDLQHLLRYEEPVHYTTSELGWDADIYDFSFSINNEAICICTGYRPFGNVEPSYTMTKMFDSFARNFDIEIHDVDYEQRKAIMHELALTYIKTVLALDE